jgi:eukaryotic-like serine/threonine-protein kinase
MTPEPVPSSGEEARTFLQERLAFLGKAYGVIALSFYTAATTVAAAGPQRKWAYVVTGLSSAVVLGASAMNLAQWLICRRGRRRQRTLLAIDGVTTTVSAFLNSLMVLATFPGEVPGLSYARALLLVTFGLVIRAVVVPSTARRTLWLGLLASCFPVATSHAWYRTHLESVVPPVLHAAWTWLWAMGAVTIATLASRVLYGLRRQVREAQQLGQYTLLEKVGEGGMGAVYRASHAMLRRPTAVKLLPPSKAGREHLERFEREVQLTSRLTHPNTVAIFDYGRTPDGVFYYAMEYLEGLNLEDLVRLDGPQPAGRVVQVLRQVAGSLAEAHGIGLIHRDVKPANVILVPERGGAPDVAKVVDFGLVKTLDRGGEGQMGLTQDDHIAGTPLYLSPEAITAPERVDARSDLYSLGCIGYYLLTGQRVFEGRNVVEVCSHHLHSAPTPPSERLGRPVPDSLSALLMACLEKEPERRPRSARELLLSLHACRDVPAWTEEEARAWWSRAEGRRRPPAAASLSSVGTMSILRRADVARDA